MLELALEAASGWRRQGWDVGVAVDLSARQLTDHALPAHLTERLVHWRLPPSRLVVEVTESRLMDVHRAGAVLRALRDVAPAWRSTTSARGTARWCACNASTSTS